MLIKQNYEFKPIYTNTTNFYLHISRLMTTNPNVAILLQVETKTETVLNITEYTNIKATIISEYNIKAIQFLNALIRR